MAQHKPKKGTYRVRGNTGQPMDFPTRKRAKNVARQIQGGKVTKNTDMTGCGPVVLGVMATAVTATGTAVSYIL